MSIMNPYEAPPPADDRMPTQRRRKLIVGVAMAVGAGMIIVGMAMFYVVQHSSNQSGTSGIHASETGGGSRRAESPKIGIEGRESTET